MSAMSAKQIMLWVARLSTDRPRLVRVIKFLFKGVLSFMAIQALRKVWYTLYHRYNRYPPGPIGLPYFGCFFQMIDQERWHAYLGRHYYPISMVPFGPKQYNIMISDLDLYLKLSKRPAFSNRPPDLEAYLTKIPKSFAAISGENWKQRRDLFYHTMLKIADSQYLINHVLNNIENEIICPSIEQAIATNNGKWLPRKSCTNYVFNTLFGASFGPDFVLPLNDPKYKEFQENTAQIFGKILVPLLLTAFSKTALLLYSRYFETQEVYMKGRRILSEWIENMDSNHKDFDSYVRMMLNSGIDREVAMSDMTLIFMVGAYTTSEALELMLFTLAQQPSVQEDIYKELRTLFNDSDVINIENARQLNKAHLLRAFIEETLRFKAGFGIPRYLEEDVRVDFVNENQEADYYILPKGNTVHFNASFMMKNASYGWKEPQEWDINNYLNENGEYVKSANTPHTLAQRYKISAFGIGTRGCPGMSLARKEIMFALSVLIYTYRFSVPNGDQQFEIPDFISGMPVNALPLTVMKRQQK